MSANRQPGLGVYRIAVDAVGVLGVLAIFAVAIGIGYLPMYRQRNAIEQRISTDLEFLRRGSEIETRHARLTQCLTESENLLADLLARVPDEPQESEFLAQLANLAGQSGLNLDAFRPGKTRKEGRFGTLEIHFSATGTYEQICRFVCGLDDMPRFCRVNSLKVAAEDENRPGAALRNGRVHRSKVAADNPPSEVYPLDVELLVYFSGNGDGNS